MFQTSPAFSVHQSLSLRLLNNHLMAPTPPEQIAKQHSAAVELILSQVPCAPRINHGEVPLEWKAKPTCPPPKISSSSSDSTGEEEKKASECNVETDLDVVYLEWCVSSRGQGKLCVYYI